MAKKCFYAVVKGHNPGIFQDWDSCEKSIHGYSGQKYKGFSNKEDAIEWYKNNGGDMSLISEVYNNTDDIVNKECCLEYERDKSIYDTSQSDTVLISNELQKKVRQYNCSADEIEYDLNQFCERYPQFQGLSIAQKNAVQTMKGKSLLFAVPGSGKTTVLIARTGYLLYGQKKCHIFPDMLMNLTFTVAAAREMATRFESIFDVPKNGVPSFSTIHSFCWNEILPLLVKEGFHVPSNLVNTNKEDNQKAMSTDYDEDNTEIATMHSSDDCSYANSITTYSILKKVLKHFKLSARDEDKV